MALAILAASAMAEAKGKPAGLPPTDPPAGPPPDLLDSPGWRRKLDSVLR